MVPVWAAIKDAFVAGSWAEDGRQLLSVCGSMSAADCAGETTIGDLQER